MMYKQLKRYGGAAILAICLIIAVVLQSRSFVMGSLAGLIYYFLVTRKLKINTWQLLSLAIVFIAALYFLIFFIKSDSSEGRLLIYKVSFNMLKGHWLTGVGWGGFQTNYLYYQAAYFKTGHYSTKELLLADNTYFAFNDYYQFFIETGFIGISLLVLSLVVFIRLISFRIKKQYVGPFFYLVVAFIIMIGTAALFTHVFEKLVIQITVVSLFLLIIYLLHFKYLRSWWLVIAYFIIIGSLCGRAYYYPIFKPGAYQKLNYAKELAREGYNNESKSILDSLKDAYQNDFSFLSFYATRLLLNNQPGRAVIILNRALKIQPKSDLFTQLGNAYRQTHKTSEADSSFNMAINMVPNRFKSRYELFNFYVDSKQKEKAIACATIIINLPVKVPSLAVSQIRKNITTKLKIL